MNDLPAFLRRYFQSLAGCAYLFAGGVLLPKHRAMLYTLCKHFGFEREAEDPAAKPAPTVPKISAAEVIGAPRNERTRAFLKIEDGCQNFCSYCIIPYARGPVKSRHLDKIHAEAAKLVAAGFKEIVLTGIHLGAYGRDLPEDVTLADACRSVSPLIGREPFCTSLMPL